VAADATGFQPCGVRPIDHRPSRSGVGARASRYPHPSRDVYTWPYGVEAKFEDGWGFSNAPPIVGGVIALVKSANPRLSPRQIHELLVRTAYDREGFKVLDAEAAVKAAMNIR
jgi:subtilisin family serine protease